MSVVIASPLLKPNAVEVVKPQQQDARRLQRLIALEAQRIARLRPGHQPLVCLDKGAGHGPNATTLTDSFRRAVENTSGASCLLLHSDLACDFNQLSARLEMQSSSYSGMISGCFLQRQLPDSFADMIVSNAALHWIDTAGHTDFSANHLARLAAHQWSDVLSIAFDELKSGGALVISMLGRDAGTRPEAHGPLKLLADTARQFSAKRGNKYTEFNLPVYRRTMKEAMAPLESQRLKFRVVEATIEQADCPFWEQFCCSSSNVVHYADQYVGFVRGFSLKTVRKWIVDGHRSTTNECVEELVDQFYTTCHLLVEQSPQEYRMTKHRLVMALRKS